MIEAGLVASGLTGAWVRTVQGLIFLASIIFYLYADEPQRRAAFLARIGFKGFGRARSAG
jgi:simple sugar transport system permease protein